MIRFRLLGSLGVETGEGPVDLGPPKQRSVLAVLLLHANEIVSTDRIIEMVWGDSPPRTAEHSVQIYVSDLRKALSNGGRPELIETRPPGYVLNIPPDAVDTLRFERLVRDGLNAIRTGDVAGGRPKLETALTGWTGAPLADFAYEDFAQGHIRSLSELRSDALEALGRLHLDQGDESAARDVARQAIEADPLREEPRRLLMMAFYRSGRQAEALRHFGDYQSLLAEELGIEPSDALRELEERILLQDPTLSLLTATAADGNPYRGLRSFSEDDSDVYFGRESLVAEVLDVLETGSGFVSIIGPSGSGKSSAAQAGVVPALRARGETVVVFQPGARPLWELAGALDRAGYGSRASLLRRFETDSNELAAVVNRPLVLIVDQFEELFTLAEPGAATRFAELISTAIRSDDTTFRVVATLRADYYDKPLSMPALAGVFTDSVVSVKPMTPIEIERAVVEPAAASGARVEPALLVQIVSDMGNEPGALPLLQFTLFELYERKSNGLTLADYEALGGLHGALTGGADEILEDLDVDGRELVEQLMMRMIQKGRAMSTSRPVLLRDLLDLDVDRVTLQQVLESFGSRRLLTFDRDASGSAIVEIAHEYLISEWPQLASWIELHSEDLDRLYILDQGTDEWITADRSEDYLLRGERLERFVTWRKETSLRLTRHETEFIDASVTLRARAESAQLEQSAKEAALTTRARRRLWYFGGAIAALAAAVTVLVITLIPERPPDAAFFFLARGDGAFGDVIGAGIDSAKEDFGIEIDEFSAVRDLGVSEVEVAIAGGVPLVFIEANDARHPDVFPLIERNPGAHFVLMDCVPGTAPPDTIMNATCITTKNEEIGFLAGVAAALASDRGRVGFIGGADIEVIHQFQAGFEQGVAYVDSTVEVDQVYLTGWNGITFDVGGFSNITLGEAAADYLRGQGADVIFHAAGFSGWGLMNNSAIEAMGGGGYWTIGVDKDQYVEMDVVAGNMQWDPEAAAEMKNWLLTSVVKRLDLGIREAARQFVESGTVEEITIAIANDGVAYTTSGGHVDPFSHEIDLAIQAVKDGTVIIDPELRSPTVLLIDLLLP